MKMGKEIEFFCKVVANEKAQNKEFWQPLLGKIILDYLQELNYFTKQNNELIQKYQEEKNKTKLINPKGNFHYSDLQKLLTFLKSGNDLINNDSQIKKEKFEEYEIITIDGKKSDLKSLLAYSEKKLKLKGIQKIHNYLQLIIAFYKFQDARTRYINKILLEEAEKNLKYEDLTNQKITLVKSMSQLEKQNNYYVQAGS